MAFDQQRNWDIQMADNLTKVKRDSKRREAGEESKPATHLPTPPPEREPTGPPIFLPDEVILQILDYVTNSNSYQQDLAACCLLSHQWYQAAVPLLYASPHLYGKNFEPFVKAICPSINPHVRKSPLSELVKMLDMGHLVHHGSKSMTARILGRVKANVEVFVAPQASFAINCFPALGKCSRLRSLDLSLVSECPPLPELFKTVVNLAGLKSFKLPRSSGFGVHFTISQLGEIWPPNLEHLTLSGGIDGHFLHGIVKFPQTLRSLTLEHCPQAKGHAVMQLLKKTVRPLQNLEKLKIANMPRLSGHALDDVLFLLPQLKKLSISVDYITPAVFDDKHFHHSIDWRTLDDHPALSDWPSSDDDVHELAQASGSMQHGLRSLELTNSGNPGEDKVTPIDLLITIDERTLPHLREVRVAKSLLWGGFGNDEAEALADALHERSKDDWELKQGVFAKMGPKQYTRERVWEEHAGVWQFDG
ncbi:hypothetical protein K431DRAFT_281629 [Polychaeton citri CBS 116435]|uniref:F-box domain-containing protein n=1 Tax=Polychaeton citri CBS 116435 TaxID=1314669 RepID=A0A9P4QF37_9PEZI|nr:hypothetical protein K431DRAFT_281629 [Polychaeton citri CBS 116435]